MGRWRWIVIATGLLLTLIGIRAGDRLDWEWNFMNLEPEGLRSVELQDEIIEKYKLSISISMLTADSVGESRRLRKKLKEKGIVGEVDDISMWVSRPDLQKNLKHLDRLHRELSISKPHIAFVSDGPVSTDSGANRPFPRDTRAEFANELDRLWANIVEIQALSFTAGQDRVVEKTTRLVAEREKRDTGLLRITADRFADPTAVDWHTVDVFARLFERSLHRQADRMSSKRGPVTLESVPDDIRAKYTSEEKPGFLLLIMPKKNLFERADLELFQEVVTGVHPSVTGFPQMMLNMNLETLREGRVAALAAVTVILIVLMADFRRPLVAVLSFLPLVSGLALTFGVMWLLDEKINYINIIALPVIIGIGVDDGVHFFHRYIQEGSGGMGRAVSSVGRAMLMTSLTTMIGFGSLMLYMMRGMASLGLVLFVGVGMCFVVTVTLLPALAALFEKRINEEAGS
jgi:hypothetical protein